MIAKRDYDSGRTMLWLTGEDTHYWANRPGALWACSELSGRDLFVEFDGRGDLVDIRVDGRDDIDVDGVEVSVCTSYFLRQLYGADHPAIRYHHTR